MYTHEYICNEHMYVCIHLGIHMYILNISYICISPYI